MESGVVRTVAIGRGWEREKFGVGKSWERWRMYVGERRHKKYLNLTVAAYAKIKIVRRCELLRWMRVWKSSCRVKLVGDVVWEKYLCRRKREMLGRWRVYALGRKQRRILATAVEMREEKNILVDCYDKWRSVCIERRRNKMFCEIVMRWAVKYRKYYCFKRWKEMVNNKKRFVILKIESSQRTMKIIMHHWLSFVKYSMKEKEDLSLFVRKRQLTLLHHCYFNAWKRHMQKEKIAKDYLLLHHQRRLLVNSFKQWREFYCNVKDENNNIAKLKKKLITRDKKMLLRNIITRWKNLILVKMFQNWQEKTMASKRSDLSNRIAMRHLYFMNLKRFFHLWREFTTTSILFQRASRYRYLTLLNQSMIRWRNYHCEHRQARINFTKALIYSRYKLLKLGFYSWQQFHEEIQKSQMKSEEYLMVTKNNRLMLQFYFAWKAIVVSKRVVATEELMAFNNYSMKLKRKCFDCLRMHTLKAVKDENDDLQMILTATKMKLSRYYHYWKDQQMVRSNKREKTKEMGERRQMRLMKMTFQIWREEVILDKKVNRFQRKKLMKRAFQQWYKEEKYRKRIRNSQEIVGKKWSANLKRKYFNIWIKNCQDQMKLCYFRDKLYPKRRYFNNWKVKLLNVQEWKEKKEKILNLMRNQSIKLKFNRSFIAKTFDSWKESTRASLFHQRNILMFIFNKWKRIAYQCHDAKRDTKLEDMKLCFQRQRQFRLLQSCFSSWRRNHSGGQKHLIKERETKTQTLANFSVEEQQMYLKKLTAFDIWRLITKWQRRNRMIRSTMNQLKLKQYFNAWRKITRMLIVLKLNM